MNRPGQQPQRPPNLGPTPNMGGFRGGPYQQAYGLPPRGVMQGYPNLQNHRAQNLVPQASPGFIQQRTVGGGSTGSGFSFGGSMQQQAAVAAQQSNQQHQPQSALQQQQPPQQQSQQPHPQPQSQNVASGTVPPHLTTTGLASNAQHSNSEVGLDPNDFPALGSANTPGSAVTSNSASNANLHSSYATQAGTGVPPSSTANPGTTSIGQTSRDFNPDDFPALSGQAQSQGTPQSQDAAVATQQQQHPPGINGFQQQAEQQQQQHRQTLLGSMTGQQQNLLGQQQQQTRGLHSGYETEKRNNFAKLNQNWNPSTTSTQSAPSFPPSLTNGVPSQQQQHLLQQTHASQQQQAQHLNAPPGVPPPSTYAHQQQYTAPSAGQTAESHHPHPPSQQASAPAHPQTPAQQLLMSPADRWGLLGLLALIKSADPDMTLLSVGADLANLGLNVGQEGNIYSNFITPWSDSTAAASVEPEFHLPACYNVQPPPPGPTKAAAFSDETLFFMFYSSPRDALQEVAAQELWNRNWRWHKELRHWLTKETGTSPSQKVPGGEAGTYTFWDPESWTKERKELTVLYTDLEEKSIPAFVQGPGLQPHPQAQSGGLNVAVGAQIGMQNTQLPHQQRGGYQGMGIVTGMA